MLRGLDIRDMLIIDRLELEFQPGLNVLTGETGAGKSILLDSLGFVLGWRGRAELVREGAEQGEVTAWFDLPPEHPAFTVLEDAGLDADGELVLRRINRSDGRKSAWINDRRASGEVLRQVSETLVELHGQHDDRGLLNPRGHRVLLDDFASAAALQRKCAIAWRALRAALAARAAAAAHLEALRAEEEFLRHSVGELEGLTPEPGEEAALDTERRRMQAAERVMGDIAKAHSAISGQGAESAVSDAIRWLDDSAEATEGALDPALEALAQVIEAVGTAEGVIADVLDRLSIGTGSLEQIEERLFAIRALARKHGIAADDLAGFAEDLRVRLDALDAGDRQTGALEQAVADAQAAYDQAAGRLTAARVKSAKALDKAMAAELAPLKMERAVFETRVTRSDPGPDGWDEVAFTVATNPGAPAGTLNKIASGGELSRFLLALKVCLTGESGTQTLIFDEIDRGVGGATADAVGKRLKSLADQGQVLVVTHSPQVAALGAHHWRVEKHVVKNMTRSTVVPLDPGDRIEEVARMLAGDTITDAARDAARVLLRTE
jgi:DNA repair protein RecN (Recombination protein N)